MRRGCSIAFWANQIVPLIQAVVERTARLFDAFRANQIVPLIQAVVERTARLLDAFR